MALARTQFTYAHPKSSVWAVLADIGNVQEISPGIVASRMVAGTSGMGAVRECDFGKGAGIHEEITSWKEGEQIQLTGIKMWGAPMKKMVATFDFAEEGDGTTVSCVMDYDMKMGWLLNPLAKGQMTKAIHSMLAGVDQKLSAT